MHPQEVIQNLGELPPLPQVAVRVLRISADSDSSSDDLRDLIRSDQALTSQVLKVANSAMFGMMREVTTLTQAVFTLGFSTARSVVLATSVKNLFSRGTVNQLERILWEHALVTAIAGHAFSKAMRNSGAEEIFLAGLMHDIGKSALLLKFPGVYEALLRRVQAHEEEGLTLELETFGFDHAMVGEALLKSWNLSEGIIAAVRWHHDPLQVAPEHRRAVALVALGNQVAADLQVGLDMPNALLAATRDAQDILHLADQTFQEHRTLVLEAVGRDKTLITGF